VLQRFDFTYSSPQATPLSTRHSLSALPSDESVESSGPYPELVGCLMYLMTCTRPDLAYPLSILARYVAPRRHRPEHMAAAKRVLRYLCSTSGLGLVLGGRRQVVLTGHADASWADDQATQRSSQGYTFSLGSGSVSWRSTRSSSVLGSSCEAEVYAGSMAAQELRWLTYLLTDLGEPPRSPPVLYVDNKAMLALCREHRLEHRTKHIALRYFLARELQQRGQLRLAYVASEANTADIFTKALPPGDHQRLYTMLACFALLDWSCDLLFSPTLPMGSPYDTFRLFERYPSSPNYAIPMCCPTHPSAYCDFYFDGFQNSVPSFHIKDDIKGDHAVLTITREQVHWVGSMDYFAPGIRDYKTNGLIAADSTNGTYLQCPQRLPPDEHPGDQFYLNQREDAIAHVYVRNWKPQSQWHHGIDWFNDRCILLPFTHAQVPGAQGPINLNKADNSTDYPEERRCVVFRTRA
ncbi:unnamed protein product, partial [Closterium sp. NIES-53]